MNNPRDTRPIKSPEDIETALVAGAAAAEAALGKDPRFADGAAWRDLRRAFHVMPDADRRTALTRLLLEEAARVAHDHGAGWNTKPRQKAVPGESSSDRRAKRRAAATEAR